MKVNKTTKNILKFHESSLRVLVTIEIQLNMNQLDFHKEQTHEFVLETLAFTIK